MRNFQRMYSRNTKIEIEIEFILRSIYFPKEDKINFYPHNFTYCDISKIKNQIAVALSNSKEYLRIKWTYIAAFRV